MVDFGKKFSKQEYLIASVYLLLLGMAYIIVLYDIGPIYYMCIAALLMACQIFSHYKRYSRPSMVTYYAKLGDTKLYSAIKDSYDGSSRLGYFGIAWLLYTLSTFELIFHRTSDVIIEYKLTYFFILISGAMIEVVSGYIIYRVEKSNFIKNMTNKT